MKALSVQSMADLLTLPYGRGGEILEVPVGADVGGFTVISPYDFKEFRARYDADPPQPKYIVFPKTQTGRDSLQLLVEYSVETSLLNAIGPTSVVLIVSSADGFPTTLPFNIKIENEVMTVTSVVAQTRWRVTRGAAGTTAVAHDLALTVTNLQTVSLEVPAKTFSGTSFAIPTPALAGSNLRLRRFKQSPVGLAGAGANNWGIVALLGNISKLLWVLGWEKDNIRHYLEDTQQQRRRSTSHGFSLDLLGQDLNVPRFPPREHSFDLDTVALYHFNDDVPDSGPVLDETTRFFNLPGHPGKNVGAQSGATGNFGKAFSFPGPNAGGSIQIPSHADFDIPANGSFTVEVFVNADDRGDLADTTPRIVIMRRNNESADPVQVAGWSLSVGSFRGIANNVMWAMSDGVTEIKIFADINMADRKFHHVAGVIDRQSQRCRLVFDGQERASADISNLGAIVNNELIRIGSSNTGNRFSGAVDEVRLSRVARSDFHPVLGEGDDAYRQRLGIFERWLLPTPGNLLTTINSLVQVDGQRNSFVLLERNRPVATASRVVRIIPASLPASAKIDRHGNFRSDEADVSGRADDEKDFKDIYLFTHNRPEIDYGNDQKNHLMQNVTARALDALVGLLTAAPIPNKLLVSRSFQPTGDGLHRVGRALRLGHQTLALEQLGVFAHRAGFDFVENDGTAINASVAPGEKLEIVPRNPLAPPFPPIDLFVTQSMDLSLAPASLPSNGLIKWTLVKCGAGRAHFEKFSTDPPNLPTPLTSRSHLSLVADAAGEITLRVEYSLQGTTVTGTRTFLISIKDLADKATIAANGAMNVTEAETTGRPGSAINEIYLITSNVAVNFGADPNNQRMHLGLEQALKRLVAILGANSNQLQILKAYDPQGPRLHPSGRAIRFRHATLSPGALSAAAFQAGFGFILRDGNEVYCSVPDTEKIEIVRDTPAPNALPDELTNNESENLRVRFSDLPISPPFSVAVGLQAELDNGAISNALKQAFANQGVTLSTLASVTVVQAATRWTITDVGRKFSLVKVAGKINVQTLIGNYTWNADSIGNGKASFGVVVQPLATLTPREPGLVSVNVTYLESDPQGTVPYTLEIRLKDALNVPQTIIAKHQYDLLMNVLNYFHPIGVEVITQNIREHVVELKGDLLNAFPGYTYPNFRG